MKQLTLSLQFAISEDIALQRAALPRHQVVRWIRHALECDAQMTVRIVDVDEGRRLNRDYRHRNYATNVLTFSYRRDPLSADLVLCAAVVAKEAKQNRRSLPAHYAHLVVHGTLHAQGWDHETSASNARAMEAREVRILAGLGIDNPYA